MSKEVNISRMEEITQPFNEQIPELVDAAESFVVESEEDVSKASEFMSSLKKMERAIEDKRLEVTRPINESIKTLNAMFKELSAPILSATNTMYSKIMSWRTKEKARIEEERMALLKAQALAAKNNDEELVEAIEELKPAPVQQTINKAQTRLIWTYEVIDTTKVPIEFLEVNTSAVGEAVRKGIRDIPGIKIYQKEILAITR